MPNIENLKPFKKGQVSSEVAKMNGSKGGIAKAKKMQEEKIFKKAIAERMGYDDFEEMIDNLITRAKIYDKSFEVLRDTMGQKPKEELEVSNEKPFEVNIKVVK